MRRCPAEALSSQVHFDAFPGSFAKTVQQTQPIAPRYAVERIRRRPEGNEIQSRVLRHCDRALERSRMVVPIEQKVFPFQDRLRKPARIAEGHYVLHRRVSLGETSTVHVFLR